MYLLKYCNDIGIDCVHDKTLDIPFYTCTKCFKMITFIELKQQKKKQQNDKLNFVNPYLTNSVKWKYDYIIFGKKYYLEDKKCLKK